MNYQNLKEILNSSKCRTCKGTGAGSTEFYSEKYQKMCYTCLGSGFLINIDLIIKKILNEIQKD